MKIALINCQLTDRSISGGLVVNQQLINALARSDNHLKQFDLSLKSDKIDLLAEELSAGEFDIILQDSLFLSDLTELNQALACLSGSTRSFAILHGLPSLSGPRGLSSISQAERDYLSSVDGLIFVSEQMKHDLERILDSPLQKHHIMNPGRQEIGEVSTKALSSSINLVTIVNPEINKGWSRLVAWLNDFALDTEIPWQLDVVGIDQQTALEISEIENLASRIKFWGQIPRTEVYRLLNKAHFLLIPSYYESYCLAATEALGHGVPVIHDTKGGLNDFIEHQYNGVNISLLPEDGRSLNLAIASFLQTKQRYAQISQNCRKSFHGLQSWDQVMMGFNQFLRSFVNC